MEWASKAMLAAVGVLVLCALLRATRRRTMLPYPPSPPQEFLLGNLRQAPRVSACLVYEQWGKVYGPLLMLRTPFRNIVVINSYQVARDLLDKRGQIYSDRPRLVMAGELIGLEKGTALGRFGPIWKQHRKYLNQALNHGVVTRDYAKLQERQAYQYIISCLDKPLDYMSNLNRMTGQAVTEITYGASQDSKYDFIALNEDVSADTSKAMQGYLVDLVPLLKWVPEWIPGARFKTEARVWGEKYRWTRSYLIGTVKQQLANDTLRQTCYAGSLIQNLSQNGTVSKVDEDIISGSAFTFYRAGNDTTVSALMTLILAMSLHPEVQAKAQAELDSTIGRERLPTLADRSTLPYITAIANEVLRWVPPLPTGLPHRLMEDDTYDEYLLPKGSTVIANLWAMSRDETIFPNADKFDPYRYLDPSPGMLMPQDFVFGFGRRYCPGVHIAFQGIWIAVATILWAFRVEGGKGSEAMRTMDSRRLFELGLSSKPIPFDCEFKARFPDVRHHVEETLARYHYTQ